MPSAFRSEPYNGVHPLLRSADDWRDTPGLAGIVERSSSYGNWGGPGNRVATENQPYIAQQRAQNPAYDEATDPRFVNDPRYAPIDGMDAAAERHDSGYNHDLRGENMFGWQGMRNVHEDDRRLVAATQAEMDQNGDKYSDDAISYSEGLRGFFGARVMGMDAVDWMGAKAHRAGEGVSDFVDQARGWESLGDAGRGLWQGAKGAGHFLADTGAEAWHGIGAAAGTLGSLGPTGMIRALAGFGDVAISGAGHLAGRAWDGAKSIGSSLFGWLSD